MQYEFKISYVIKEGHCFPSGLDLQNCGCQDHEDTIDLRLHMLLRFVLDWKKCSSHTLRSKDKGEDFLKNF